jgi:hypothetical protein
MKEGSSRVYISRMRYGAPSLKGDTRAYGSGASLPRLRQVCFFGGINGYNTVPLCSLLALFTYKNSQFQSLITS